jgi:cell division protein FtsX
MPANDGLVVAAAALLLVFMMLVWSLWYVVGLVATGIGVRFPRLPSTAWTMTLSVGIVGILGWVAATYYDSLMRIVGSLGH